MCKEELPVRGYHLDATGYAPAHSRGVARTEHKHDNIDWDTLLAAANQDIHKQRTEAYNNSEGSINLLYKNLPQLLTKEDLLPQIEMRSYPIMIHNGVNVFGFNDLGELAIAFKRNLVKADIEALLRGEIWGMVSIIVNEYRITLEEYLNGMA